MRIKEVVNEGIWQGIKNFAAKSGFLGQRRQLDAISQDLSAEKEKQTAAVHGAAKAGFIKDLEQDLITAIKQGVVSTSGATAENIEAINEAKSVAEFVKRWLYDQFKGYSKIDSDYTNAVDKHAANIQKVYAANPKAKFPTNIASDLFDLSLLIRKSHGPDADGNVSGPAGAADVPAGSKSAGKKPLKPTNLSKGNVRPATKSKPATGGAGAFGQMAQQLTPPAAAKSTKSSTGGTIARSTGVTTHRAAATNPNQPTLAAAKKASAKKSVPNAMGQMAQQLTTPAAKSSTGGTVSKVGGSVRHSAAKGNPNTVKAAAPLKKAAPIAPAAKKKTAGTPKKAKKGSTTPSGASAFGNMVSTLKH